MTRNGPVPQLKIEQYALGELPEAQARELEATMGKEVLLEHVAAIRSSNAEVLARMPPRRFAAAVDQRQPAAGPRWWMVALPVAALLAALVVVPRALVSLQDDGLEHTRQKGVPTLHVHKQAPSGAEFLERGDEVEPGDVLQLSYAAAGAEFGAVVSVDGAGMITWHLPRHGERAVRLNTGTVPLDHSYELDDAPAYERFVFITGPAAFDLVDIERSLEGWSGAELHLDPMLSATVFDVQKPGEEL